MAGYISDDTRKVTTHRLVEMKQRGEKISMLTAYDYTMAQIVDGAGMDVILVGDSASNVMAGNVTTLPITLDQMIYHAASVVRGVKRALVVVDMPFGSYQGNSKEALNSAIRIMKETAADAIKLEGGEEILESIQRILSAGIPVMGHLGLTPRASINSGPMPSAPKKEEEAEKIGSRCPSPGRSRLFCHRAGEDSGSFGSQSRPRSQYPHHRHRCRWRCRRSGTGCAGYAGHEQRFPSPFPASLCRPSYCNDGRYQSLHLRCEELRLPE